MIRFKQFVALLLAAWAVPLALAGQNLVINGSFDEANLCTEYEAKCAPAAWFYVYATGPGWGYKPHINNSAYALQLFSARKKDDTRSFWQTMLAHPVIPGRQYRLELDVSAENGKPDLNDIGIVLSNKMYFAVYTTYRIPEEYISLTDAQVTKLNNGWYHLSKICSFPDTLQVLVVGNFSPKTNTKILEERKDKDGYILTNIDNLSLQALTPVAGVAVATMETNSIKDSLYQIRYRHRGLYDLANGKTFLPVESGSPQKLKSLADTLIVPEIAFAYDSYQLVDRPLLVQQLQSAIHGSISKILVEGFTDAKGSVGYNDTLSSQRAAAVASLLTAEFPLVKYLTESRGSGISTKYAEDSKNRRVEIIIFKQQTK
jgi:hypothetical protein